MKDSYVFPIAFSYILSPVYFQPFLQLVNLKELGRALKIRLLKLNFSKREI